MSKTMTCQWHILSAVNWHINDSQSQIIYHSFILDKLWICVIQIRMNGTGVWKERCIYQRNERHIENNIKVGTNAQVPLPSCSESKIKLHKCSALWGSLSYEPMQQIPNSLVTLFCNAKCNYSVFWLKSVICNTGLDLTLSTFLRLSPSWSWQLPWISS